MIIAVPSRFSCSAYTSVQDGIWNSEYVVSYARKMHYPRNLYIVNAVFRVHTFSLTLCRRSYGFCLFNVSVQVTFIYKKWLSYADDAQFTTGDHLTDHPNGFVQIVSNL